MEEIYSHHRPTRKVATHFSNNGIDWSLIPDGIEVRGSRYAIILNEINEGDLDLDLSHYEVGYGPSRGKVASNYIKGRVDKACIEKIHGLDSGATTSADIKKITHLGKIVKPYAVLVK